MAYFGSMMENPFAWLRTQGRSAVVFLYLACIAVGGIFIITSAVAQEQEYVPFKALYASIDGGISPAQVDLVAEALAEAQDMEAGIVVIRLDTSGGLVASMRDIVKLVLNAPVPVAVWVGPFRCPCGFRRDVYCCGGEYCFHGSADVHWRGQPG